MTLDELLTLIDRKEPPAPADRLSRFEAELGTSLPDDYQRFLIACNGGYLGGSLSYDSGTPGRHSEVLLHHVGGFREESHFSLESARAGYQASDDVRIPLELLWIMDDPFGNAFCLGLRGEARGRVYFWDHEEEQGPVSLAEAENVIPLAGSFTDFVAGLKQF